MLVRSSRADVRTLVDWLSADEFQLVAHHSGLGGVRLRMVNKAMCGTLGPPSDAMILAMRLISLPMSLPTCVRVVPASAHSAGVSIPFPTPPPRRRAQWRRQRAQEPREEGRSEPCRGRDSTSDPRRMASLPHRLSARRAVSKMRPNGT